MNLIRNTAYRLFLRFGYDIRRLEARQAEAGEKFEPEFERLYERCKPFTMTSRERMYGAYQAARYVAINAIPGDLVECGVWRGGSAMIMVLTLAEHGVTDRNVYLYDTYEGMAQPGERDKDFSGNAALTTWERHKEGEINTWCYSPLEEVKENLASTGYPAERIQYIKGLVEDTIPGRAPTTISVLRLDTDWYDSTKHELIQLYPRLVRGGILIIDDYGDWQGSKEATDEYFSNLKFKPLLCRLDSAGRIAVKVE